MRLIDADALDRKIVEMTHEPAYQHTGEDWLNGLCMAMEAVNEAPTVEAVVLPCKLGDPVFIIGGKYRAGRLEQWINTGKFRLTDLEKIGKTVFLTREEAEAALAKMG